MMEVNISHDDRVIRETGMDQRIAEVVLPVLKSMDFQLVRVCFNQKALSLQVMAERQEGAITVGDCAGISQKLSSVLERENLINGAYSMEVSSPGVDRPLVRKKDFEAHKGCLASIRMRAGPVGKKALKGHIVAMREHGIEVALFDPENSVQKTPLFLMFEEIADIRLVIENKVIRNALAQHGKKPARQENRIKAGRNGSHPQGRLSGLLSATQDLHN